MTILQASGLCLPRHKAPAIGPIIAVVLTTIQLAVITPASADDLPAQLLTAARMFPASQQGRLVCMTISGLINNLRIPAILGDQQTSIAGSTAYSASTQGAYLGDGPTGSPAPPFVQALLDASVAAKLILTWSQHTHLPTMVVPQLQDTNMPHTAASGPPQAMFVDKDTKFQGDAYLVTGSDKTLFANDRGSFTAATPPVLAAEPGIGPASGNPNSGSPPPGVWPTSHVCYTLIPDRVLEYENIIDHGNGVQEVSAAVLFRPERIPDWISDPRVVDTLQPNMKPLDVRVATFRNDGDGWRPLAMNKPVMTGITHLVGSRP